MRGDAGGVLAQASVERLPLAADSVDLIFCDPPYVKDLVHTYRWLAEEAARVLKPGAFVLAMAGGNSINRITRWLDDAGLEYFWLYRIRYPGNGTGIVWKGENQNGHTKKPVAVRGKWVLAYVKPGSFPAVARTATTEDYVPGRADKRWHHWGQDIDSHRYYIDCFSAPGDLVLDPFIGGGTTAAACELLGRRWLGLDIDRDALVTTRWRMSGGGGEILDPLPLFANEGNHAR